MPASIFKAISKNIIAPLSLSLMLIAPAFADQITIKGMGIVTSIPDIVYINIGVTSNAATARIALDKNSKAMRNIITALTKFEVEKKDIQTSNFSINPVIDRSKNNRQLQKIVGYNVRNSLNITVRKIDDLGPILDRVITLGSNNINNIQFATANPSPLKDQARVLAAKDAKRRAQIYAQTLGFSLGKILTITEIAAYNNPNYRYDGGMMMEASVKMAAPIETGEQATTSEVSITWEINQ